jgi:hypothetical protein
MLCCCCCCYCAAAVVAAAAAVVLSLLSYQGTQSYLREGEAGDPKRLFIGGVGSLYRFRLFEGMWEEDVREGPGSKLVSNLHSLDD